MQVVALGSPSETNSSHGRAGTVWGCSGFDNGYSSKPLMHTSLFHCETLLCHREPYRTSGCMCNQFRQLTKHTLGTRVLARCAFVRNCLKAMAQRRAMRCWALLRTLGGMLCHCVDPQVDGVPRLGFHCWVHIHYRLKDGWGSQDWVSLWGKHSLSVCVCKLFVHLAQNSNI